MADGDITQVVLSGVQAGQRWMCSFGIRHDGAGGTRSDLLGDIATHNDASGQNFLQSFMYSVNSTVTLDELRAVDVKPGTKADLFYSPAPALVGGEGASGELLPPTVALVSSFYTDLKGRSYRGRVYLPGGSEGSQTAGVWSAAHLLNQKRMLDWLYDRYGPTHTNTNFTWVVISRFLNKAKRVTPIATPITSYAQHAQTFSQRRRWS